MSKDTTSENLRAELQTLADTLEEVLNTSSEKSKTEIDKLHNKAQSALKNTRARLDESGARIVQTTREAADRTDVYVRDNPWTSVGIGAAIGVVLGVLLSRR